MKKNSVFTFALMLITTLAVAVLISGCAQYGQQKQVPAPQPTQTEPQVQPQPQTPAPTPAPAPAPQPETPAASVKPVYISVISVLGFKPEILVVKAGDTVVWINNDTVPRWPASAAHPTHTVYPELGGCIGSKFDACRGLAFGEQWNFTFNVKGTWSYHDHLKPTTRARIVVE